MDEADSPLETDAPLMRMPKPPVEALIGRALRLRCPRCGIGPLFSGWFTMPERCSGCRLKYERAPGYFLGAAYINYGITAVLLLVVYPTLHYGFALSNKDLAPWLAGLVILFPLFAFRYARALWLALDCQFDRSMMEDDVPAGAPAIENEMDRHEA
jgi:uncharacterized protein (DUF983 family)